MAGSVRLTPASAKEMRDKRADWRQRHRDDARAMLRTESYIHTVHDSIDALLKGYEKQTDAATQTELVVPLDKTRVQSIKSAADLALRLLSKTLPDLKSVELEDNRVADPKNLSTPELMALIEKLGQRPIVQVEDAQYVEVEAQQETPNW